MTAPEPEPGPASEPEPATDPPARRVAESVVEMTEHVLPNDTNPLGTMFGGKVLQWIDIAGGVAAIRHCRRMCVTASMDQVAFINPIAMGEIVVLKARLVRVGRTSMEVRVDVLAEEPLTGRRRLGTSAHVTFVALGPDGKKTPVPRLILETDEERRLAAEAEERRALLLEHRRRTAGSPS